MAQHPTTGFDLDQTDLLLKTTKQVRKRLDLTRPVPYEELLECIDIASHAPMGGNLERNRWMIIDDSETKAKISEYFGAVGRPYLAANTEVRSDDRSGKVIDSAMYLVEHLHEVPALVLAMRLDRVPDGSSTGAYAGYYGSVLPGVWSFQLAALARDRFGLDDVPPRARGRGRRAARHPTDGHPGVSPRGRLLHRGLVQPGSAASGRGGHLSQPLEAARRVIRAPLLS